MERRNPQKSFVFSIAQRIVTMPPPSKKRPNYHVRRDPPAPRWMEWEWRSSATRRNGIYNRNKVWEANSACNRRDGQLLHSNCAGNNGPNRATYNWPRTRMWPEWDSNQLSRNGFDERTWNGGGMSVESLAIVKEGKFCSFVAQLSLIATRWLYYWYI